MATVDVTSVIVEVTIMYTPASQAYLG